MIFIDSNIPMYVIGGEHPNKAQAISLLEDALRADETMVTSTEVFQEILQRYTAIGRLDAIDPAFACLHNIVDHVFTYEMKEVDRARAIINELTSLSARDALHIAVMERAEIKQVMTFDNGFDRFPWLERLSG